MASVSSDPITAAMIETEKEVAGFAWDNEDTEAADATGDRSLEGMGDGLEGQHEADEDADAEGEDADGEAESEAEGETEAVAKPAGDKPAGEVKPEVKPIVPAEQREGRVPAGRLREATERTRAAEAERDALKADNERRSKAFEDKLEAATRRIDELARARTEPPKPVEAPKPETIPDIFEDPKGFAEHLTKGFQTELSKRDQQLANQRVETSMAIAHAFHKDTFEKAFAEINKLNVQDPDARQTVQRIYNSPNPGEALVSWHKRNETFARVGDDPAKFEESIRVQTREALMKDPEFRKQLIAEMRKDAEAGDDGRPRTTTRIPRSLALAQGSNVGAERLDPNADDGSPEAIANAAWR